MNPRRFRNGPRRARTPLAAMRLGAGITSQKSLAENAKMNMLAVQRIETGISDPKLSDAKKLANILSVSLEIFYAAWAKSYDQATERLNQQGGSDELDKSDGDDEGDERAPEGTAGSAPDAFPD